MLSLVGGAGDLLADLTAGGDQFGQLFRLLVLLDRAGRQGGDEPGDDLSVDAIGLGQQAHGLSELTHTKRVQPTHRQVGFAQGLDCFPLVAAAGLQADRLGLQRPQPPDQFGPTIAVIADLETSFGHVDPDKHAVLCHLHPLPCCAGSIPRNRSGLEDATGAPSSHTGSNRGGPRASGAADGLGQKAVRERQLPISPRYKGDRPPSVAKSGRWRGQAAHSVFSAAFQRPRSIQ